MTLHSTLDMTSITLDTRKVRTFLVEKERDSETEASISRKYEFNELRETYITEDISNIHRFKSYKKGDVLDGSYMDVPNEAALDLLSETERLSIPQKVHEKMVLFFEKPAFYEPVVVLRFDPLTDKLTHVQFAMFLHSPIKNRFDRNAILLVRYILGVDLLNSYEQLNKSWLTTSFLEVRYNVAIESFDTFYIYKEV